MNTKDDLLIMLVGESGAGKSTLCRLMGCDDYFYSSSGAIVSVLKERDIEVTHDSIHAFANEAYGENPEWQVPQILAALREEGILILDGPRRLGEVLALKREVPNARIIKVVADEELRFARLQGRDNVDSKAFERVLQDEAEETELKQLLNMAETTIVNNGSIGDLEIKAVKLASFISEYNSEDNERRSEFL